jgi:restriction system protein
MRQKQNVHIIVLHDEPFILIDLHYLMQETVTAEFKDDPNICIEAFSFRRDDEAVEHIVKHSENVCLIIQNLTRGIGVIGSEYLSRWAANRVEGRPGFSIKWDGGDFYWYVIDAFIPEASCIFCTAFGGQDQIDLLHQWAVADPRIELIEMAYQPADICRLAAAAVRRWLNKPTVTELSNETRLILPVAEEWAAICGANEKYFGLISPFDFEKMVAAILRNHGFSVELTAQTRDGGYDIVAVSNSNLKQEVMLVETKRWRASRCVPVGVIRSLYGVKKLRNADRAMLVTTSYVSADAKREFSGVTPIEMEFIERENLLTWCRKYRDDLFIRSASGDA